MGAVKTAVGRKATVNRTTRVPGIRLLVFVAVVAIFVAMVALIQWLVRNPSIDKSEASNRPAQDLQEISRLKRQAMRKATNSGEQGADEREYYRSALRMLRRLNDIHSRL